MVAHTVFASIADGTSAAAEDTIAASGFVPTGENEIQQRDKVGGLPSLIGHGAVTTDVAVVQALLGAPYYRIECNTWEQARYIKRPIQGYGVPNAGGSPIINPTSDDALIEWLDGAGIPMDRDADWTVKTFTTTVSKSLTVALQLSYGQRIPWMGAPTTWRLVPFTSDAVANVWTDGPTITDLDPRVKYRVSALGASSEDQATQACRVTSPQNNTFLGTLCNHLNASANQPHASITRFPLDSILVDGVESIQVSALCDAAEKPQIWVGFTPISSSGRGGAAGAPGGAVGGALPSFRLPTLSFGR